MIKYLLAVILFVSGNLFAEDFRTPINLPACDIGNPKVVIINTSAGFSQINDPSKTIFCVEAGNYSVDLRVRSKGTLEEPRYLRYFDPNETLDTHPVHMEASKQAVIEELFFWDSAHWVVDRIVVRDPRTDLNAYSAVRMQPRLPYNSWWADDINHVTLNRMLIEGSGGGSGQVAMGGYNLTIQDSVIRKTFITTNDDHCMVYYGNNNKVVGNEIYNCTGDSIQVSRGGNISGGVIAYNELYATHDWRTDGEGNLHQYGFGEFLCQENAIGFKGAGTETSPLLVKGNKMWGFDRDVDHNCATGGGGIFPISLSFNVNHLVFEDNIIYDNSVGAIFANPTSENVTFRNNLFFDLDYAISAPTNKAYNNKYIDNLWYDIDGQPFLEGDISEVNEVSGNKILDKQVCWTKFQITNPTEVCVGKGTTSNPISK